MIFSEKKTFFLEDFKFFFSNFEIFFQKKCTPTFEKNQVLVKFLKEKSCTSPPYFVHPPPEKCRTPPPPPPNQAIFLHHPPVEKGPIFGGFNYTEKGHI